MEPVPYQQGSSQIQAVYHIVPDTIHGGWNVYDTSAPQEPQRHFINKEEAIGYVEQLCQQAGVGFIVEDAESPSFGQS
ncbi:MAG TPA: hypothetical protein V6C99_07430 [Oculatellaceae cyanobacterium]|jgi:hypothetical protein